MEQRLLIILGLLITSNTGFVLALLPQLPGGKGSVQVKEGGRKASRGEKESPTIFPQLGVTLPPGSASPGPQGTPIPGYEQMSPSFHLEPDSGGAHRRERRCTCYTYKDKECVYYCHLDIIWINTPERTVPYGLSSYRGSVREKRSTNRRQMGSMSQPRCSCTDPNDQRCVNFCIKKTDRFGDAI
ncbi:endothelin-3 isoform 2-T2 [Leptodactylus fuscus]|uniref:endothelin-3 isoform X2 n=1 Tax=Leptodactylus fuscus TaxID=238119 RepID=UPI003F4F13DC